LYTIIIGAVVPPEPLSLSLGSWFGAWANPTKPEDGCIPGGRPVQFISRVAAKLNNRAGLRPSALLLKNRGAISGSDPILSHSLKTGKTLIK
jgi:hypothetical protein